MITYSIAKKKDGFGAQYQSIMSGIAFCDFKKFKYIHTKFKVIDRCSDKEVKKLNNFIGVKNKNDEIIDLSKIDKVEKFSSIVHSSKKPDIFYTKEVINKIRNFYYSTEKPEIKQKYNDIVIHIRRGDVTNDNPKNKKRFIPNHKYKNIIKMLKKKYPTYSITIFSEGNENDFKEIQKYDVRFQLNKPIDYTFHAFVSAKILVTSRSSLSYSAAILNKNIIYYFDFWHKPLKHWNIL